MSTTDQKEDWRNDAREWPEVDGLHDSPTLELPTVEQPDRPFHFTEQGGPGQASPGHLRSLATAAEVFRYRSMEPARAAWRMLGNSILGTIAFFSMLVFRTLVALLRIARTVAVPLLLITALVFGLRALPWERMGHAVERIVSRIDRMDESGETGGAEAAATTTSTSAPAPTTIAVPPTTSPPTTTWAPQESPDSPPSSANQPHGGSSVQALVPYAATSSQKPGPPQITQATVDAIELGMTMHEVIAIAGSPGWDHFLGFSSGYVWSPNPVVQDQIRNAPDRSIFTLRLWTASEFGRRLSVIFKHGNAVDVDAPPPLA